MAARDRRPLSQVLLAHIAGEPEQSCLGEEVIYEQASDDQRDRRFAVRQVQQRERCRQQSHLPHGGVAKQALRVGLLKPDQVRDDEGRHAERGDDRRVALE